MEKAVINATRRTVTGKKVGALRRNGVLPAVMYGHNFEPISISLDFRDASRTLFILSSSSLVYVNLDGKENACLVRQKQRDPIRNIYLHIDFQVVSLTEKIRAITRIELVGTSPAVKDLEGVIVANMSALEIECFPQDLPDRIQLDISGLVKIGDSLHVRDITPPANVEILTHAEEMVVIVTFAGQEEVVEVVEPTLAEPELLERGKKEEEEAE
jgi:large subunit ribosomal protein L25